MELSITETRYKHLQSWAAGQFINDYRPYTKQPRSLDDVDLDQRPGALDQAALHFCMGGPFHPGCELTWPMRQAMLYRDPFRVRIMPEGWHPLDYGEFLTSAQVLSDDGLLSQSGPGDLTRWMSAPWQADTASCQSGYNMDTSYDDPYLPGFWLARVPNQVLTEEQYRIVMDQTQSRENRIIAFQTRQSWLRVLDQDDSYIHQINRMNGHFGELGVIVQRPGPVGDPDFPEVMYVETQATLQPGKPPSSPRPLSREFAQARFRARFRKSPPPR